MEDIVVMLHKYRPADRRIMIRNCDALLSDVSVSEDDRIACVKILIGLLPLSLEVLEKRLDLRDDQRAYENHFTMFCFLDLYTLEVVGVSETVKERILGSLSEYLYNVNTEEAHAAWMCGDLLGDHWENNQEAIGVLLATAENAHFVAGRLGALHGVEHWVDSKFYHRSKGAKRMTEALRRISNLDRSPRVRSCARGILGHAVSRIRCGKKAGGTCATDSGPRCVSPKPRLRIDD